MASDFLTPAGISATIGGIAGIAALIQNARARRSSDAASLRDDRRDDFNAAVSGFKELAEERRVIVEAQAKTIAEQQGTITRQQGIMAELQESLRLAQQTIQTFVDGGTL